MSSILKDYENIAKDTTRAAKRNLKPFLWLFGFSLLTLCVIWLAYTVVFNGLHWINTAQEQAHIVTLNPTVTALQVQATATALTNAQLQNHDQATAAAVSSQATITAVQLQSQATVTAIQAEQNQQAATAARAQADAPFWDSIGKAVIFLAVLIVVGAAALVGAVYWLDRAHRRRLESSEAAALNNTLSPDSQGNYPVRILPSGYIQPTSGNILQPVPQTLTFSPNYQVKEVRPEPPQLPAGAATLAQLPAGAAAPTFAELLEKGLLGPNRKFILGYSEGEPLFGSWLDLYSSAIGGKSGMGKTTTVRFIVLQSVLNGAKLIPIDPHAHAGEESLAEALAPLERTFLFRPAVDTEEILAALDVASRELQKRLHDPTAPRYPLLVCVDEMTSLMRTEAGKPLSTLLQDVAQQGRKVGIFALCMGQIWKGSTSGGTELRDSFASAYVHRMSRNQARMLLPTDEARAAERLTKGQAILYKTNGDLISVSIPLTTPTDANAVAAIIETATKSSRNHIEAAVEINTSPSQSDKTSLSAEEGRIVSLFKAEKDVAAIVREIYGVSTGSTYQKRSTEVQAVLRRVIEVNF